MSLWKFSVDSLFSNIVTRNKLEGLFRVTMFQICSMARKKTRKRWKSTRGVLNLKIYKHLLLTVTIIRKLLKSYQFRIYVPFWLQEQVKQF